MRQGLRLRTQFVLAFSSAVLLTLLLFAVTVTGVLVLEDWVEHPHPAADFALREGLASELWPVLGAMALSLPVALVVAVGLGRALAVRALAPMVEAARRARAARASPLDLSLPMRGTADEWDELAATLNTLLGDARGALERVHRFTADAAHELRTPLTVLRGEAEVALRRERTPAEYQRALRAVHEEALRLGSLVEALLALARADAGSLQLHLQPLGLRALAQEAVGRAQATLGTAPGRLQVQLAEGDGLTRGDKALLGQVLDNLLANALRHARTQVRVEAGASPDTVWVEVRDDGAGVPREFLPRLFERFARADAARTRTGTGLGLSIARSLVQAHGGRLTYVPAPGGGSIFRMELPAPQDDAPRRRGVSRDAAGPGARLTPQAPPARTPASGDAPAAQRQRRPCPSTTGRQLAEVGHEGVGRVGQPQHPHLRGGRKGKARQRADDGQTAEPVNADETVVS